MNYVEFTAALKSRGSRSRRFVLVVARQKIRRRICCDYGLGMAEGRKMVGFRVPETIL